MEMRWFKRMVLPAAFALAVMLPGAAFAAPAANDNAVPMPEALQEGAGAHHVHGHGQHMRWKCGGLSAGVHQQMYIMLLAEKYAPETANTWKPVLAETTRLHNEMKKQFQSGTFNRKEWKEKKDMLSKDEMKQRQEERKKVYGNFDQAIQSNDSVQIKASLGGLMEFYQKRNIELAAKLKEMSNPPSAKNK